MLPLLDERILEKISISRFSLEFNFITPGTRYKKEDIRTLPKAFFAFKCKCASMIKDFKTGGSECIIAIFLNNRGKY